MLACRRTATAIILTTVLSTVGALVIANPFVGTWRYAGISCGIGEDVLLLADPAPATTTFRADGTMTVRQTILCPITVSAIYSFDESTMDAENTAVEIAPDCGREGLREMLKEEYKLGVRTTSRYRLDAGVLYIEASVDAPLCGGAAMYHVFGN